MSPLSVNTAFQGVLRTRTTAVKVNKQVLRSEEMVCQHNPHVTLVFHTCMHIIYTTYMHMKHSGTDLLTGRFRHVLSHLDGNVAKHRSKTQKYMSSE